MINPAVSDGCTAWKNLLETLRQAWQGGDDDGSVIIRLYSPTPDDTDAVAAAAAAAANQRPLVANDRISTSLQMPSTYVHAGRPPHYTVHRQTAKTFISHSRYSPNQKRQMC